MTPFADIDGQSPLRRHKTAILGVSWKTTARIIRNNHRDAFVEPGGNSAKHKSDGSYAPMQFDMRALVRVNEVVEAGGRKTQAERYITDAFSAAGAEAPLAKICGADKNSGRLPQIAEEIDDFPLTVTQSLSELGALLVRDHPIHKNIIGEVFKTKTTRAQKRCDCRLRRQEQSRRDDKETNKT